MYTDIISTTTTPDGKLTSSKEHKLIEVEYAFVNKGFLSTANSLSLQAASQLHPDHQTKPQAYLRARFQGLRVHFLMRVIQDFVAFAHPIQQTLASVSEETALKLRQQLINRFEQHRQQQPQHPMALMCVRSARNSIDSKGQRFTFSPVRVDPMDEQPKASRPHSMDRPDAAHILREENKEIKESSTNQQDLLAESPRETPPSIHIFIK